MPTPTLENLNTLERQIKISLVSLRTALRSQNESVSRSRVEEMLASIQNFSLAFDEPKFAKKLEEARKEL